MAPRSPPVKTVRFAKIVEKSGTPEPHLLLSEPAKDRDLQSAIKAQRVMTVFQESVGTKADRGEIGFQAGKGRQFLIFPRSLRRFAGHAVVGIKYELYEPERPAPGKAKALAASRARQSPPEKKRSPKSAPKPVPPAASPKPALKSVPAKAAARPKSAPASKVVPFSAPRAEENDEVAEMKRGIRKAITALEQGKQVVAFNLLKRLAAG